MPGPIARRNRPLSPQERSQRAEAGVAPALPRCQRRGRGRDPRRCKPAGPL